MRKFKKYNSIDKEELKAASAVIKSGNLSNFLGEYSKEFFGGPKVREFEKKCKSFFNVKHAITVNSWTSGLICAVGALDINPGDEIILPPWTMSACASAILNWNAIPVFADIDKTTYNIDPDDVLRKISKKTKAIMAVDIFGHPCNISELKKISKKYKIKLITDSAQSPYSFYKKKIAGTISDVGGISLNYHKHIHTGEGGVIFTNSDKIAKRINLIRNHAESVVRSNKVENLSNMIGYNFRLGEIESAIGIQQLKKLKKVIKKKQKICQLLTKNLSKLSSLFLPKVLKGYTHSYYIYGINLDLQNIKYSREYIINKLTSEGVLGLSAGYTCLHLLPMFQKKIAYGSKGFPWNSSFNKRNISYKKGICPNAEYLHEKSFIKFEVCMYDLTIDDVKFISSAFEKVWSDLKIP
jgi:dTDP-4-amino-4,6-dideoxygalactose transaminase